MDALQAIDGGCGEVVCQLCAAHPRVRVSGVAQFTKGRCYGLGANTGLRAGRSTAKEQLLEELAAE